MEARRDETLRARSERSADDSPPRPCAGRRPQPREFEAFMSTPSVLWRSHGAQMILVMTCQVAGTGSALWKRHGFERNPAASGDDVALKDTGIASLWTETGIPALTPTLGQGASRRAASRRVRLVNKGGTGMRGYGENEAAYGNNA